jgi:hypothetical protein
MYKGILGLFNDPIQIYRIRSRSILFYSDISNIATDDSMDFLDIEINKMEHE